MAAALFGEVDERRGEQRFHVLRLDGIAVLGARVVERRGVHVDECVGLAVQDLCPTLMDVGFRRVAVVRGAVTVGFGIIAVGVRLFVVLGSHASRRGCSSIRAGLTVANGGYRLS